MGLEHPKILCILLYATRNYRVTPEVSKTYRYLLKWLRNSTQIMCPKANRFGVKSQINKKLPRTVTVRSWYSLVIPYILTPTHVWWRCVLGIVSRFIDRLCSDSDDLRHKFYVVTQSTGLSCASESRKGLAVNYLVDEDLKYSRLMQTSNYHKAMHS